MYEILCDIWKNPGASFSPMPFWFWNDELDREELLRQVDDFHKKGIDGFILHPRMGMSGVEYLSEEYLDLVEAVVEAAQKRFMLVALYDEGMYPSGSAHGGVVKADSRLAARRLYALPADAPVPEREEPLYLLYVRFEDGQLADVSLSAADGFEPYHLILGYTGGTIRGLSPDEDDGQPNAPKAADLLNPAVAQTFLRLTHERYYERLSSYFGQTVIGFFTDEPSLTGRGGRLDGGLSWSYGFEEAFFEAGGDFLHLAALLFPTEDKKLRKDAEYCYRTALNRRLGEAYYAPLSRWCAQHRIALMGHPAESGDCGTMKYFDIPGQDLVWRMVEPGTELTAADSVMVKCAADCARHRGISRSSNECFGVCGEKGNPWNFTPDDMMWYLNFLFARGCSLVIPHAFYYSLRTPLQSNERPPDVGPHAVWWKDYRRIAGYIKRMSWLNATGTNNPEAAVLCTPELMPVSAVRPLYEAGITFNYLTVEDFMERTRFHEGKLRIDRYEYGILLVDGSLRLNAEIAARLEEFAEAGGKVYRGSEFGDFMKKNARRTSYFEGETGGKLRFTHYTKSGCPFFLFLNEGTEEIHGRLITDLGCAAARFDPFTGKTEELAGELTEGGFAYPVTVPGHSSVVIGMNPDALPHLRDSESGSAEEWRLAELIALSEGRMRFSYRPAENRRVLLSFTALHDMAEVSVNGQEAGRLLFMPYELDVTALLREGENEVSVAVTGSMANVYGSPVPVGFEGLTVRIYEKD